MNIIVLNVEKFIFHGLMFILFFGWCLPSGSSQSVPDDFKERQTRLRGELSPQRSCFDVIEYCLKVDFDLKNKSIRGLNEVIFDMLKSSEWIQLDLFDNMNVEEINLSDRKLEFYRDGHAIFINSANMKSGRRYILEIIYSGKPLIAKKPPWDGGFIWSMDDLGRPWVAVACEGFGASSWWPNKDHLSDEPRQMTLSFTVPDSLQAISNGQLIEIKPIDNNKTEYTWHVSYPLNNYNATFYIGHYEHFKKISEAKGREPYDLNYYVLDYNLDKAQEHFIQTEGMLEAFEHYLGPYPFMRDGFALVEAPYAGMEHQSAIAYGNAYLTGYLGGGIPNDLKFDYIILHESAHEYWGNSVSADDHGEMWLHESFTTYMESLYVEYKYGYKKAIEYLKFQRPYILNRQPMLGPLHVNYTDNDTDIYYKGSWFLHTMRQLFTTESEWFDFLRRYYNAHKYSSVNTSDFTTEIGLALGKDMMVIVNEYLENEKIPALKYYIDANKIDGHLLFYRWSDVNFRFNMPLKLVNHNIELHPSIQWQSIQIEDGVAPKIQSLRDYYLIELKKVDKEEID